MSVVFDEIQRQKPLKAVYYRLTKKNSMGIVTAFPDQKGFWPTSKMPDSELAPGKYGIEYLDVHLKPITLAVPAWVQIPSPAVAGQDFWKRVSDPVQPALLAQELKALEVDISTTQPKTDEPLHTENTEPEPPTNPAATGDRDRDREIQQQMRLMQFEQEMLIKNQQLTREQLATKEIGEVYNHQHSGRLEIHAERQLWMEERRNWMRLQMEAEKAQAERQKIQLGMMSTAWEAMEKTMLQAIAKHAAPPTPPPDYTPVLMQAVVTAGGAFNTFMAAYFGKDKGQQHQMAAVSKKLAELGNPVELAKAFSSDPNKLADFLKDLQEAFKPGTAPTVPDNVAAISARLAEVTKLIEAQGGGTQQKDTKDAKDAKDTPTKVVE